MDDEKTYILELTAGEARELSVIVGTFYRDYIEESDYEVSDKYEMWLMSLLVELDKVAGWKFPRVESKQSVNNEKKGI